MRILIVEDNRNVAANISDYLEPRGAQIDYGYNGEEGLRLALSHTYDVIILDIMLPRLSGLDVCMALRREHFYDTPILMLTALDTVPDKIEGFAAGADDFLVKPFALAELEARIQALHRRHQGGMQHSFKVADLELDKNRRECWRAGRLVKLNPTCFKILEVLLQASPNVVSVEDLEHFIWLDNPPDSGSLRSHLYLLRQKIDKPFPRPLIHTVHGIGYQLLDKHEGESEFSAQSA